MDNDQEFDDVEYEDYYPDDIAGWGSDWDGDYIPTGCRNCGTDAEELEITEWGCLKRHWSLDCPYCARHFDGGVMTIGERIRRGVKAVMSFRLHQLVRRVFGRSASGDVDNMGEIPF